MVTLTLDNRYLYVEGLPLDLARRVVLSTSYLQAGYKYSKAFRGHSWDGRRKVISALRDGRLRAPAGVAQEVVDLLDSFKARYELSDKRRYPDYKLKFDFDFEALRPYQRDALESACKPRGSLRSVGRGIIKMPPRSGKTRTAGAVIATLGVRTLFVVPSTYLLYQARADLQRVLGVPVGLVGDNEWTVRDVTVATAQTLTSRRRDGTRAHPPLPEYLALLRHADLVIVDECFPARTLIDGSRSIESLQVGDLVPSFDPMTETVVQRKVIHKFARKCGQLVRVHFQNGARLVCTPNHPVLTREGWQEAKKLATGEMVRYITSHAQDELFRVRNVDCPKTKSCNRLLLGVSLETAKRTSQKNKSGMLLVQEIDSFGSRNTVSASTSRPPVLFGDLLQSVAIDTVLGNDGSNEQEIRFAKNEGTQPDAQSYSQSQATCDSTGYGLEASSSRGQRQASSRSSTPACFCAGMGDGSCDSNRNTSWQFLSDLLQNRHCRAKLEDRDRGGRLQPQRAETKIGRPKKDQVLGWIGVDYVEILEPGSDGTFSGVCPDGLVYNLEVEGTNTYFANQFVVHNCHHLSGDSEWRHIVEDSGAPYKLGLSATVFPDHVHETELGIIWLRASTGDLLIDISISDLIDIGYLVPTSVTMLPVREPDLSGRGWSMSLHNEAIYKNEGRNLQIVDAVKKLVAAGLQTVVITNRLEQIAAVTRILGRTSRVRFGQMTGKTEQATRESIVENFRAGKLQVIVSTVMDEGVDIPEIEAVVVAEGGQDIKSTYQRLRCMTPKEGKDRSVVVDFLDLTHPYFARHSLNRLAAYKAERAFRVRTTLDL